MKRWLVYQLFCRRLDHVWGPWVPVRELLPDRSLPPDWYARECERGCGHVELPQPGL